MAITWVDRGDRPLTTVVRTYLPDVEDPSEHPPAPARKVHAGPDGKIVIGRAWQYELHKKASGGPGIQTAQSLRIASFFASAWQCLQALREEVQTFVSREHFRVEARELCGSLCCTMAVFFPSNIFSHDMSYSVKVGYAGFNSPSWWKGAKNLRSWGVSKFATQERAFRSYRSEFFKGMVVALGMRQNESTGPQVIVLVSIYQGNQIWDTNCF